MNCSLVCFHQDFQQYLTTIDMNMGQLHEQTRRFDDRLPLSTMTNIDRQYSTMNNRYQYWQQHRTRLEQDYDEYLQQIRNYWHVFEQFTDTIDDVHRCLHDRNRTCSQLTEIEQRLRMQRQFIEQINDNEYRVSLSKRLKSMHDIANDYSYCEQMFEQYYQQCTKVEHNNYQSNFVEHGHRWMTYIQAIEQHLSIVEQYRHTSYRGLTEIDENLSKTIDDFQQRQRQLLEFVRQGRCHVEYQQMSIELEQRWQHIIDVLVNKHQQVKEHRQRWSLYQTYRTSRKLIVFISIELATIFSCLDHIRRHNVKHDEPSTTSIEHVNSLENVYELDRNLTNDVDRTTRTVLEEQWNDIQALPTITPVSIFILSLLHSIENIEYMNKKNSNTNIP
jgi:hypothetical protein